MFLAHGVYECFADTSEASSATAKARLVSKVAIIFHSSYL